MSHWEDDDESTIDIGDDDYRQNGGNQQHHDVAAMQREMQRLRDLLDAAAQGTTEARYFEQVKKNREMNVKYEAEKTRSSKLMNRVVALERQVEEAQQQNQQLARGGRNPKAGMLPSERGGSGVPAPREVDEEVEALESQLTETKLKLDKTNRLVQTLRQKNDDYKRDMGRMKKLLGAELGEDNVESAMNAIGVADVDQMGSTMQSQPRSPSKDSTVSGQSAATAGSSGWRGRAQQISLLKQKVKDLQRQVTASTQALDNQTGGPLPPPDGMTDYDAMTIRTAHTMQSHQTEGASALTGVTTTTRRDFDDVNRERIERKEQKRLMETRDLQTALKAKDEEIDKERSKHESLQARMTILERDNQHLKMCIQRMMEKTENDDNLIAAYKEELEVKRHEMKRALTAKSSNRDAAQLDTELKAQRNLVADLRRENHRLKEESRNATFAQPPSAKNTPRGAQPQDLGALRDDNVIMAEAKRVIEEQRQTIIAYEEKCEILEKGYEQRIATAASEVGGLNSFVKKENESLKERVNMMQHIMDREINLYKSIAAQTTTATTGRHPSTAENARRPSMTDPPSASSGTAINSARSTTPTLPPIHPNNRPESGNSESNAFNQQQQDPDYQTLQQQYNELKREYNGMQMRMQREESKKKKAEGTLVK